MSTVRAHAIHTTLSVVTSDAAGTTIMIRAFADDFSASVSRFSRQTTPADWAVTERAAAAYAIANFRVRDAAGQALIPAPCGLRREGELYFLCLRVARNDGAEGWRLQNAMLTELHADQVNIVQVTVNGSRRTMLFTKGSAASALSG